MTISNCNNCLYYVSDRDMYEDDKADTEFGFCTNKVSGMTSVSIDNSCNYYTRNKQIDNENKQCNK